jgi:crotonobetainyl-CoA:carnitine CoA-transferase CaiB-like acyl-CoA transferase
MAGWPLLAAGEGNPPLFIHNGTLDILTGAASAVATLLALYHREHTGRSAYTEAALLNTAAFTNSETSVCLADGATLPFPVLDSGQHGISPGYRIYETADGWISIAALDEPSLAAARAVAGVEQDAGLAPALSGRECADLLQALRKAGVPAELVRQFRYFSVWDDEENLRTRMVVSYHQRDWGQMQQFGAYWSFGDLPLSLDRACPALGEHTGEVLAELGFSSTDVEVMRGAGAVTQGAGAS